MIALGAGVEAAQAALDAPIDALVVAGLEVGAVQFAAGAPMAAVERVLALEEQRHHLALIFLAGRAAAEDPHGARTLAQVIIEERAIQIGRLAAQRIRRGVKGKHLVQRAGTQRVRRFALVGDAALDQPAALPANLLALV